MAYRITIVVIKHYIHGGLDSPTPRRYAYMRKRKASPLRRVVAENIRMERARRRIAQEDLAQMAGVSRVYMGAIERAESSCSVDVMYRIAQALNVKPADLVTPLKRR